MDGHFTHVPRHLSSGYAQAEASELTYNDHVRSRGTTAASPTPFAMTSIHKHSKPDGLSNKNPSFTNPMADYGNASRQYQHRDDTLMQPSYPSNTLRREDGTLLPYYTGHAASWPADQYPTNPLPIPSSGGYLTRDGALGSYSSSELFAGNPGSANLVISASQGVITPDLSPQSMSLSPSFDKHWGFDGTQTVPGNVALGFAPSATSTMSQVDGVRKKNAKFEIPEGRNLDTIDRLIAREKDEDALKELKAQKRLLKNREAALQSRQRKKLHTECLEGEKRRSSTRIEQLERDLAMVMSGKEQLEHEKAQGGWQNNEAEKTLRQVRSENQELQQRVCYLQAAMQRAHGTPGSTVAGSAGYTDFADDMNGLTFANSAWNGLLDDASFDVDGGALAPKQESRNSFAAADRLRTSGQTDMEAREVESKSLLVLLLAGAFISSSPSPQAAASTFMSQVPRDIRVVVGEIIDFLLRKTPVVGHGAGQMSSLLEGYSKRLFEMLQEDANSDAMLELRDLFDRVNAQVKAETPKPQGGQRGSVGGPARRR